MKYRLCSNGRGVLMTREPRIINDKLEISYEGITDGYTAVIKNCDKVYYRPIREGRCELEASKILPGIMQISIKKDDSVNPTWILDELYVARNGDCVAVAGNTLEYDRLLAEQRAEMDELRADMLLFKAELEQFRRDFDEVYADADILN